MNSHDGVCDDGARVDSSGAAAAAAALADRNAGGPNWGEAGGGVDGLDTGEFRTGLHVEVRLDPDVEQAALVGDGDGGLGMPKAAGDGEGRIPEADLAGAEPSEVGGVAASVGDDDLAGGGRDGGGRRWV